MGIIAPEKKSKRSKILHSGKRSIDFWWIILVVLIFGIPLTTVELLSDGKTIHSAVKDESLYFDDESSYVNTDISSDMVQTEKKAVRFNAEAEYYFRQPVKKDRKTGIYRLSAPVMDEAGIFKKLEYIDLASFIMEMEKEYGVQIVVLSVKSMHGLDIESFGGAHAQAWRLGQEGKDNGVLLTISMEERDVRIDTGYGSEAVLTDAICSRIIRNIIIPEFKRGNYYEGVSEAIRNMAGLLIQDESLVTLNSEESSSGELSEESTASIFSVFFLIVIVIIFLNAITRIGRRRYGRRGSILPWIILGNSLGNHNHHHSGGSGFGGFHGGGGGFGGGGASGHW